MWINPANQNHIIDGNDGGVSLSYDKGATWEAITNMDLGQFYHVTYDMQTPYRLRRPGQLHVVQAERGAKPLGHRQRRRLIQGRRRLRGADGPAAAARLRRIAGRQHREIDRLTGERKSIRPVAAARRASATLELEHANRALGAQPGHDLRRGQQGLQVRRPRPELDRHQPGPDAEHRPRNLSLMGVTAEFTLAKHDGVQSCGNLVQLVESPRQAGVLYAGADDGSVYMTRDDGKNWTNITNKFPGLPKDACVSRLAASAHDVATVFATFDNHRNDDYGTFVYASVDGGNRSSRSARESPRDTPSRRWPKTRRTATSYTGSEFGLFVSLDRGGRWQRFRSGLPTVPIHEIVFHPRDNDMIVATHERSIWILDDATPVQQLQEAQKSAAHLFDLRPAMQFNPANDRGFLADKGFWGEEPDLRRADQLLPRERGRGRGLRIRDAQGAVVPRAVGRCTKDAGAAGVNRVYWDLRYEPLPTPPAGRGGGGGGGGFAAAALLGPSVLPASAG